MPISGVGTIEAHLLEADFWPGITSGLPVTIDLNLAASAMTVYVSAALPLPYTLV
jgi:hypothetical protein